MSNIIEVETVKIDPVYTVTIEKYELMPGVIAEICEDSIELIIGDTHLMIHVNKETLDLIENFHKYSAGYFLDIVMTYSRID
ncbi:hypothetical protein [Heyndrickxia ginsengihumi]|uniref:hypothetical protein n=1 Tax=Heyndrickxia ginsengihumi TaxID=363870 RepID=UPI003D211DE3